MALDTHGDSGLQSLSLPMMQSVASEYITPSSWETKSYFLLSVPTRASSAWSAKDFSASAPGLASGMCHLNSGKQPLRKRVVLLTTRTFLYQQVSTFYLVDSARLQASSHLSLGFGSVVVIISLRTSLVLHKFQINLLRVASYLEGSWRGRDFFLTIWPLKWNPPVILLWTSHEQL